MELLLIVLIVAVTVSLLLSALYLFAQADMFATIVPEGEIKFVVVGGNLHKVLVNVRGHIYDETTHCLKDGVREQSMLERWFGIRWMGIYPLKQLHRFELMASHLEENPKKPILEWVTSKKRPVESLRWRFPRAISIPDVELGKDRFRVDIVVLCSFQVHNPYYPVFILKGSFFEPLEDAIRGAIIAYCSDKDMDYAKFASEPKGPNSEFARLILRVNDTGTVTSELANGIKEEFGIELFEVRLVAFDLSEKDKAAQIAAQAREVAKLQADAQQEVGRGERLRLEQLAEGEAAAWIAPLRAMKRLGVDPNAGIAAIGSVRRMQEVGKTDLTTLVEGGGASVVVTPQPPTTKAPEEKK